MRKLLICLTSILAVGCGMQAGEGSGSVSQLITWNGPKGPPTYVPDNPSCADLGYQFEIKIDNVSGPISGLYTSGNGYLDVWASSPDGIIFGFNSNTGIDAVIMKGGDGANVYAYSPETNEDSNLVAPNNASGSPAAISHISICYDYELKIWKTASTKKNVDYQWGIEKTGDASTLTLSPGQSHLVNYTVTVSSTGSTEGGFEASGTIKVKNPAPTDATVTGISDLMDGQAIAVSCPVTFPVTLGQWAEINCTWSATLASSATLVNTATVEATGPVAGNSAQATVDFSSATVTVTDDCVSVTDDKAGALGSLCLADAPKSYSYSLYVGPYDASTCGTTQKFTNTATFTTDDSGESGSDSHDVDSSVVCAPKGCSLTQGYWKTHSSYGPAPYDDTWAQLASGANTAFFGSGKTYYQILWTPVQGNAYIALAHQFIAAQLNGLNGADTSAISAAMAQAQALLSTYTPSTLPRTLRNQALQLASTLDAYNNGAIGPGHCSE